jgi:hypothetical protein
LPGIRTLERVVDHVDHLALLHVERPAESVTGPAAPIGGRGRVVQEGRPDELYGTH